MFLIALGLQPLMIFIIFLIKKNQDPTEVIFFLSEFIQ